MSTSRTPANEGVYTALTRSTCWARRSCRRRTSSQKFRSRRRLRFVVEHYTAVRPRSRLPHAAEPVTPRCVGFGLDARRRRAAIQVAAATSAWLRYREPSVTETWTLKSVEYARTTNCVPASVATLRAHHGRLLSNHGELGEAPPDVAVGAIKSVSGCDTAGVTTELSAEMNDDALTAGGRRDACEHQCGGARSK